MPLVGLSAGLIVVGTKGSTFSADRVRPGLEETGLGGRACVRGVPPSARPRVLGGFCDERGGEDLRGESEVAAVVGASSTWGAGVATLSGDGV